MVSESLGETVQHACMQERTTNEAVGSSYQATDFYLFALGHDLQSYGIANDGDQGETQ